MKKILINLFFLYFAIHASSAVAATYFPDEFSIREHWISLTKSYDIETKSEKLGTLYRHFLAVRTIYNFYDPMNIKTASATLRFFSFGIHLDIYDQQATLLGGVKEEILPFSTTFVIFGPDSSTKLARAKMNFWGTKFHIYDTVSNIEMAVMSRSYFRLKNDWTIRVTNRDVLDQRNIDPRVLMTVLAIQGEIEDWQNVSSLNASMAASQPSEANQYQAFSQQLAALSQKEGLDKLEQPSQESLEAIADELDHAFNTANQATDNQDQSNQEEVKAFTTFCFNLLSSHDLSDTKKKAILTLLNLRLQGQK